MIKDLFLPIELSIFIKEKGFNEHCLGHYRYDETFTTSFDTSLFQIEAPLYQQAIDWLREKYEIDIVLTPYTNGSSRRILRKYSVALYSNKNSGKSLTPDVLKNEKGKTIYFSNPKNGYDKVIEEALKLI